MGFGRDNNSSKVLASSHSVEGRSQQHDLSLYVNHEHLAEAVSASFLHSKRKSLHERKLKE